MKKARIIIFISLLVILFMTGCSKEEEQVTSPPAGEINLPQSAVPPVEAEIVNLENGHQITTSLKLVIDQKCASYGLKGGDTGSGYGCVAS